MAKVAGSTEGDTIRVILSIQPRLAEGINDDLHFEELWNEQASFVHSTGAAYTRHQSLQFDHRLVASGGGYEEFAFRSHAVAEDFFSQYAQQLRDSYKELVDHLQLEVFVFDCVTRFAAEQRGWWQVGAGLVVGTALRMKVLLGV
ncbi:hypothetical protein N7507_010063 [Penicillium longicatenatum]|nr:hypothetical protein N7507_010063 [Penicillium longicatenatum]